MGTIYRIAKANMVGPIGVKRRTQLETAQDDEADALSIEPFIHHAGPLPRNRRLVTVILLLTNNRIPRHTVPSGCCD